MHLLRSAPVLCLVTALMVGAFVAGGASPAMASKGKGKGDGIVQTYPP